MINHSHQTKPTTIMKLYVTGAAGFVGSTFVKLATERGHKVIALRRPGEETKIPVPEDITWVEGDLVDSALFNAVPVTTEDSALVHFAAAGVLPGDASWEKCFKVNVMDSIRLWRKAYEIGIRRFVITGSCFEYGRSAESVDFLTPETPLLPTAAYHASKAAATMAAIAFCCEFNVSLSVLRLFQVYGEGEAPGRFWPALRDAALSGKDFDMTPGDQIRDFVSVESVADQFLADLAAPPELGKARVANVASGDPMTLREFAELWWKKWGGKGQLNFGAVPYRANEVMRYVPLVAPQQ